MLTRRAPREVYRVYDAEEFLAHAGAEERLEMAPPRAGERRLHGVAGAITLVAVMGALGALLAILGLSSVGAGRRVRSGALAAAGSLIASRAKRAHVLRYRRASARVRGPREHERRSGGRPGAPPPDRRPRVFAAASPRRRVPATTATPATVVRVVARAGAGHSRPAEFGFERAGERR